MIENSQKDLPYGTSLPSSWNITPLKYLATAANGYSFNSKDWKESGIPIIRIENLNGSDHFNYSKERLPGRYRISTGDLLYAWSGNPGTSFGPFRWQRNGHYYLNQHIFKMQIHGCNGNWIYWVLRAATDWVERVLTSGMIGMVHVTKEDLMNVPIPVPSLEEQRRIVSFLDVETAHIDRLIDLDRSLKGTLDEREKASRDFIIDRAAKKNGEVALRRLMRKIEQGESPQCDNSVRVSQKEWAVLKLSSIKRGAFQASENKRLPADVKPDLRYEVKTGDLLVTRANTPDLVGDVAVVPGDLEKLLLPDLIYRVSLRANVDADFIAQALLGSKIRSLVRATARGTSQSMVKLRGEDIKSWPVPKVPVIEQKAIARELLQMTENSIRLRNHLERRVKMLEERRRAVVAAAVTGELDVTTARRVSSA